jgi:hypothetical protein
LIFNLYQDHLSAGGATTLRIGQCAVSPGLDRKGVAYRKGLTTKNG